MTTALKNFLKKNKYFYKIKSILHVAITNQKTVSEFVKSFITARPKLCISY